MNKKILTIIVLIVVVSGFVYYYGGSKLSGGMSVKKKTVLVINPGGEAFSFFLNSFMDELRKNSLATKSDVDIIYKDSKGDPEKLKQFIDEAVKLKPDAIATISAPPTLTLKDKTKDIPILTALGDPVEHGYIKSLQGSGINIAGVSQKTIELTPKRIEILKSAVPGVKRIAIFYDTTCGPTKKARPIANAQALELGVELIEFPLTTPSREALDKELQKVTKKDFDALMFYPHGTLFSKSDLFLKKAKEENLPIIMPEEASMGDVAIASYGPDYAELGRSLAYIAGKVLKGEISGNIPFEQPSSIQLVINEKNAKSLGITISEDVVDIASKIIR